MIAKQQTNKKFRQKPLLPTLKEKKRYVAFKINSEEPLPANTMLYLIKRLKKELGTFMSAKAGIIPIIYDQKTQTGIIRVNNKYDKIIRAAMTIIYELKRGQETTKIRIDPIITSGILKKTKEKIKENK